MPRDWDKAFSEDARYLAQKYSKDRKYKVGALIVGPDKEVRATGYNGFPRGANDDIDERHERPAKYMYTEHAERNAVFNAARCGVSTKGCTIYASWFPCADCARAIIQSGISTLVAPLPDFEDDRWGKSFRAAEEMLEECGVGIRYVSIQFWD